jgi:hypothetical protein
LKAVYSSFHEFRSSSCHRLSGAGASVANEAYSADIELSDVAGLKCATPAQHSISIEIVSDSQAQRPNVQSKKMGFRLNDCEPSAEKGSRSFVSIMTLFIGGGMQF